MISKGNHNKESKLINLWKSKSLIDTNYKFHDQEIYGSKFPPLFY